MRTRTRRHWKQRWDPSAPLVFLKRLRMGDDPKKPFVFPGDPVTNAMREKLGLARLRIWWNAKIIERADFDPTVRGGISKTPAVQSGIVHTGRGWYTVTFDDGSTKRVRGKDKAEVVFQGG